MDFAVPSAKSSNRQKHQRSKHKKDYHSKKKSDGKAAVDKKSKNSGNKNEETKKKEAIVNKNQENSSDESTDESDSEIDDLTQISSLTFQTDSKQFAKKSLIQPESRFAEIVDTPESAETGKSFEELLVVPLSTGHFEFKSEKNMTFDKNKFSEYFTVDCKKLATIVNCLPFNEMIGVDDEFFLEEELAEFQSTAEQNRKEYEAELKNIPDVEEEPKAPDLEEDLDFLLSLKEPFMPIPINIPVRDTKSTEEAKSTTPSKAGKSIDLEKWLDSVLDD